MFSFQVQSRRGLIQEGQLHLASALYWFVALLVSGCFKGLEFMVWGLRFKV